MDQPRIVGQAVLRDYPLDLWAAQQQHMHELLREFQLVLGGLEQPDASSAPARLVELAESFTAQYGQLLDPITQARQEAHDAGLDRMDSVLPLPEGAPAMLVSIQEVLVAVDDYCAAGDLLLLPRPPELLALYDWVSAEVTTQYDGGPATPWPGPW